MEEINEIEEIEYETISSEFHSSVLDDFMKNIKKYGRLSVEEQKYLGRRMQDGDLKAKEKLICHNYSLVVWRAYKYRSKIHSMQVMDIIQEGIIGLMRACETYNPNEGSFSNYALRWIDQAISRAIYDKDQEIRVSINTKLLIFKYDQFIKEYSLTYGQKPTDKEICKKLGITEIRLKSLEDAKKQSFLTSIDAKINENSDTEFNNFIPYEEDGFEKVLDDMSSSSLLKVLNCYLCESEFYVIYYRFLCDEKKTLDEIGKLFHVSRERIRQVETKSLNKLKRVFTSEKMKNNLYYDVAKSKYDYKVSPLNIDYAVVYYLIKNKLNLYEKKIYILKYLDKRHLPDDYIADSLNLDKTTYELFLKNILNIVKLETSNKEKYFDFKQSCLKTYGFSIYNFNEQVKDETSTYSLDILNVLKMSFDDLSKSYDLSALNQKDYELLKKFFTFPEKCSWGGKRTDIDIYSAISGFKNYSLYLDPQKIYKTFKDNEEEFSDEQRLALECFYFKKRPYSEYIEAYPNCDYRYSYDFVVKRILLLHYHILELKNNSFNKTKYLIVKVKYSKFLTEERIKLLDMYYGVNTKKHTIKEISDKMGYEYKHTNDLVSGARDRCISLYNNRHQTIDVDKEMYIPILLKGAVSFTKENETILKEFIIDGKDYKEISKLHNISTTRVSNIITENIRKLDEYYFGMIPDSYESRDEILDALDYFNYKELKRMIIIDRKIKNILPEIVSKKYNMPVADINQIVSDFYYKYDKYITRNISLDIEDVVSEIEKEDFESILSDKEKEVISLRLGIKNRFNVEGKEYTYKGISKKLGSVSSTSFTLVNRIIVKLKLIKIGLLKHPLIFISKEDMIKILNDPHVPIGDKERDIIKKIYGINCKRMTINEINDIYAFSKPRSILRRYKRAIVTIKKYELGLINGCINYEEDIVPNLKYFSKFDRDILTYIYKDKMTLESICKLYNLSFSQMVIINNRLNQRVYEILENKDAKKFNFDYFDEVVDNDDFPYTGNKEIVKNILYLYFGHDGNPPKTIPEIKKILNLEDISLTAMNVSLSEIMIAAYEYKDGIKLKKIPTYEEVKNYYDKYCDSLDTLDAESFLAYFRRHDYNHFREKIIIPNRNILYALYKEENPNKCDYKNLSKQEAINILKKYGKLLSPSTRNVIQNYYEIPSRDLMSGKEKNHVFRIVNSLVKNKTKNTNKVLKVE